MTEDEDKIHRYTLEELLARKHRKNPKKHDIDGIIAAILRFGFTIPLAIDAESGVLVAGHGRLAAAVALRDRGRPDGVETWPPRRIGLTADSWTLPVLVLSFSSEAERDAYVIADNRLTERGGWDEDALRSLLAEHGPARIESIGFSLEDYNALMSGFRVRLPHEDRIPEPPEKPITVPGDTWTLGEHRLVCADSTGDGIVDALRGELADMVFFDPPYNIEVVGGFRELPKHERKKRGELVIQNDALGDAFAPFFEKLVDRTFLSMHPGAAIYCCMSSREWPLVDSLLRARGFHWASSIIWAKDHFILSNSDYHPQYEAIWYGWRADAPRRRPNEDRTVGDVWMIDRPRSSPDHPTPKPIELMARAIRYTSHAGDLVLDPCGGSGSTLIACEQSARRAALVELEPRYCDVIVERWEHATGGKAKRGL